MQIFYNLQDLPNVSGKLLTRMDVDDKTKNKYILFESYDDYFAEVKRLQNSNIDPYFHEVILEHEDRKFFLDIDYKIVHKEGECCNERLKVVEEHFEAVKKITIREFNSLFSSSINKHNFAIIDSTGKVSGGTKYSKNLVILGKSMNQPTFQTLLKNIIANYRSFHNSKKGFIDEKQTSSTFNNRLTGSSKYICGKSTRRIKTSDADHRDLILTNTENCVFVNTESHNNRMKTANVADENVQKYLDMTEHLWKGPFKFRNVTDNKINFDRIHPSHCTLCDEVHNNDNTFVLVISNGYMYANCRHAEFGTYYECFNVLPDYDGPSYEPQEELVEANTRDNLFVENVPLVSQNAFSSYDVDFIKSGVGTGKSKALLEYLNSYDDGDIVVIVSFRVTFGIEMAKKFKKFKLYSDINKKEFDLAEYPQVIVQAESISKIKFSNVKIKCLVLDEIESIWSQFSSGNFRDYSKSLNVFEWLYRTSEKVIGMDAFISQRSYELSQLIRQSTIFTYENKYNRFSDTKYFTTFKKSEWLTKLQEVINDERRVGIFTNSLTEANTISAMLDCKNIVYSSETKNSVKKEHFSDVNKYWKEYQVVICTSTVTAGISFEEKHFDYVFGLFNSKSCNVESCMQMLGRIRDVGEREYYICLPTCDNSDFRYMTNVEDIERGLLTKRSQVVNLMGGSYNIGDLNFTYEDGLIYDKNFRYWITVHNIAFDNKSKCNFASHFRSRLKESGISYEPMKTDVDEEATESYKSVKVQQMEKIVNDIVTAEKITESEYEVLKENNSNGLDVNTNQMVNFQLRRDFGVEELDPRTVDRYKRDPKFVQKFVICRKFLEMEGTIEDNVSEYVHYDAQKISKLLVEGYLYDFNKSDLSSFRFSSCIELIKSINFANITMNDFPSFFATFESEIIEADNGEFMKLIRKYFECLSIKLNKVTNNDSTTAARLFVKYLKMLFPVTATVRKKIKIHGYSGFTILYNGTEYSDGKIVPENNLPFIYHSS